MTISEENLEQIKQMLFQGDTLGAIKLYQGYTAEENLVIARIAIQKLEEELRISSPDKFTKPTQSKRVASAKRIQSNYALRYPLFWKIALTLLCAIIGGFLTLCAFR